MIQQELTARGKSVAAFLLAPLWMPLLVSFLEFRDLIERGLNFMSLIGGADLD